jgi:tetratricopeptide (TPR) repeat protein/GTPase SAR1 family protein
MSTQNQVSIRPDGTIVIDENNTTLTIDTAHPGLTEVSTGLQSDLLLLLTRFYQEIQQNLSTETRQKLDGFKQHLLKNISQKNVIQGNITNVDSIKIGDTFHVTLPKFTAIPQSVKELSADIPRINPETDLIGRITELNDLHKRLTSNRKVVLVSGLGGIGKTTLAIAYLNQFYDYYHHIAWLTQTTDDVRQAFVSDHMLVGNLEITDIQELFSEIMRRMRLVTVKPNLLIIDNATESLTTIKDQLPGSPHWHVLATSRQVLDSFEEMKLSFLSETNALALFEKHCTRLTDTQEIKVLLAEVGYHTLTIEILAKTAQKNRLTVGQLQQALEKDLPARIRTDHSKLTIERVKSYLVSIFNLSGLKEKESWLMKQFCCLPAEYISYDVLVDLLKVDALPWQDEFSGALEELYAKGWLLKKEETDSYQMHRIVNEVAREQLSPKLVHIESLLDSLIGKLSIDQTKDNPIEKFKWISFGDSLLKIFSESDDSMIISLENTLALVYKNLGQYENARDLLEKALKSNLVNYEELHPDIAVSQSNLAMVYKDLGEYEKARDLLEKALASDLINFSESHPAVARSQSNLAMVYKDLGEYEKARDLLSRAMVNTMTNYEEHHPYITICQLNLGLVYWTLGEYEKARDLLEKALASDLINFDESHPDVANSQSSLGSIYRDLGEYEKARDLLEKALASDLINFGESHPAVARSQSNLALLYRDLGEYEKARDLWQNAFQILVDTLGKNHPYARIVSQLLDSLNS